MTMASITDYLAKQIFIEKNVVTYRSLSRQFNIHVNSAKNELATYHANPQSSAEQCYATYMISGEPLSQSSPSSSQNMVLSTQDDNGMDIDQPTQSSVNDDDSVLPGSDPVPQVKMMLVGEKDLEHAKTKYARIYSQHIYSLSPSHLVDAGLICGPSANIYTADAKLSPEQSILLGRVVGVDVHIGKVQTTKGKALAASKKPGLAPSASSSKIKEEAKVKKEEKDAKPAKTEDMKKASPAASKPKATGKLDWSKAKSKETKKVEKEKEQEQESNPKLPASDLEDNKPEIKMKIGPPSRAKKVKAEASEASSSKKPLKPSSSSSAASNSEPPKRGVKRKSALPADSDSDSIVVTSGPSRPVSPPLTKSKGKVSEVKVKKSIVLSDDEDSEDIQPKRRAQPKKLIDKSLAAMMDMDDDLVIKHPRRAYVAATVFGWRGDRTAGRRCGNGGGGSQTCSQEKENEESRSCRK
ncbi:hypothetical protein QCA50_000068 [Cerrena zonata]|uniref:DNA polymerase delta subunit 3 n=1 Tax=Cerrena zonata TaxID=2478898 RepID=A0AAW0GTR7_9APHY